MEIKMLVIFPIVFATVYLTSVATILYVGLICKKDDHDHDHDHEKEDDSDSEYET
jgi:hypothetical protein